jgi:hypothetical protein
VVVLPVGLFLQPRLVDGFVVPMLVEAGVPAWNDSGELSRERKP